MGWTSCHHLEGDLFAHVAAALDPFSADNDGLLNSRGTSSPTEAPGISGRPPEDLTGDFTPPRDMSGSAPAGLTPDEAAKLAAADLAAAVVCTAAAADIAAAALGGAPALSFDTLATLDSAGSRQDFLRKNLGDGGDLKNGGPLLVGNSNGIPRPVGLRASKQADAGCPGAENVENILQERLYALAANEQVESASNGLANAAKPGLAPKVDRLFSRGLTSTELVEVQADRKSVV